MRPDPRKQYEEITQALEQSEATLAQAEAAIENALRLREEWKEQSHDFVYDRVGYLIKTLADGTTSNVGDLMYLGSLSVIERDIMRNFHETLRTLEARKVSSKGDILRYKLQLSDLQSEIDWDDAVKKVLDDPFNKDNTRNLKRVASMSGHSLDDAHKFIERAKEHAQNVYREEVYN